MMKISKQVMLIVFLTSAALMSCEKKEVEQQKVEQQKVETVQKVDIQTLRVYFANRINAKVEDIIYNEKTQQFTLWGVDQVSLEKLTQFYFNNNSL